MSGSTAAISWQRSDSGGPIEVIFDPPNERLVVFSVALLDELATVVAQLEAELGARPASHIVFRSAKPNCFIAGANIGEMLALGDRDQIDAFLQQAQGLFTRVAGLSAPTVAVIDGACMGGGTEFALACSARVATDNAKTQIALPEVTLGIIPGWGGTQRLPRRIGVAAALPIIVGGRPLDGSHALQFGLVDACISVSDSDQSVAVVIAAAAAAAAAAADGQRHRDTLPMPLVVEQLAAETEAAIHSGRLHPAAPLAALRVVQQSTGLTFEAGLALERAAFVERCSSDVGHNLIAMFLHRGTLKKETFGLADTAKADISRAAVLGAGVMGSGISWALSHAGIPVTMKDVSPEPLERGLAAASGMFQQLVDRGRLDATDAAQRQTLIDATTEYTAAFQQVDIAIEAVSEELGLKQRALAELESHVAANTIVCTNTSSLPLAELATALKQPERFVALHFFNPVNRMALVEVAATDATTPEALATAVELARRLGKTPVVVRGRPGFLVNRVLFPYLMEAARIIDDGASPALLDDELTRFGMQMGPIRLIDEVGVDVASKIAAALADSYGARMAAPGLLTRLLEQGFTGRKGGSGSGFYHHRGKRSQVNDAAVAAAAVPADHTTVTEAAERCIALMVNEAARCYEERIVDLPLYIDLTMISGTGFPEYRGGPLRYADQVGVATVVERMQRLELRYGSRFHPSEELLRRASSGETFYE